MKINFFNEDVEFVLKNKGKLKKWIAASIVGEGFVPKEINFIFCSDDFLLEINKKFLNHDYFTDIITFGHDQSSDFKEIGGDLFVSYERILDNAIDFKKNISDELHRVMIHGVLHLVGYNDKKNVDKKKMTAREDFHLLKRDF